MAFSVVCRLLPYVVCYFLTRTLPWRAIHNGAHWHCSVGITHSWNLTCQKTVKGHKGPKDRNTQAITGPSWQWWLFHADASFLICVWFWHDVDQKLEHLWWNKNVVIVWPSLLGIKAFMINSFLRQWTNHNNNWVLNNIIIFDINFIV